MTYDPHHTSTARRAPTRRSIRLQGYDYAQAGAYFVTICAHNHQPLFGQIVGAGLAPARDPAQTNTHALVDDPADNQTHMQVNEIGQIAHDQWMQIPKRFDGVSLDAFAVMPNHIHGIIIIDGDGDGRPHDGEPHDGRPGFGQPHIGQPQGLPLRHPHDGQPHDGQTGDGRSDIGQPQGLPLLQPGNGKTLGDIVGAYKSLVANECLALYKSNDQIMGKLWQRNYYEHIIRDEESYLKIAQYILDNPAKWETDMLYAGGTL